MSSEDSCRFIVVGGGVIGLSTAYHLARLGCDEVLLLEQNELASGTSWHAAGIVGPLRATMNLTLLARYALELFPELERETGQQTGYRRTGGFWLAENEHRMTELKRIKAMGDMNELNACFMEKEEVVERLPVLNVSDLAGALWVEEDGQINPYDLCMAYARGARLRGVEVREHARVSGFTIDKGGVCGVELQDGTGIRCEAVVNCAGLWAGEMGRLAGVSVPVQAVEHMYVVTEPITDLPRPCPMARDLKGALYIKEDAGRLVIGTFERNARLWDWRSVSPDRSFLELPDNWDHLEPMLEAARHRIPCLEDTGLQHFMNGPESFTPDTRQVMGESPEVKNYFVAAGLNSLGIMSSAGVGKAMAQWVSTGRQPMDLWEVDIARFDPANSSASFLQARTQEAVANQMAMHWPFKQFSTGRNLKQSALFDVHRETGAVFGSTSGWERPLWFARSESESRLINSHGEQNWWPYAEREAHRTASTVTLFELSPFTRIQVEGGRAMGFLQKLCSANVDVEPGRIVYTMMLNADGGIESELTVTRISESSYMLVSAAATRYRDLAWIRRYAEREHAVAITDRTGDQAVIGVMGPRSRQLLQRLSGTDLSNGAFPFGTSRDLGLNSYPVRAARVSFVGELGWEVYACTDIAERVYRILLEQGGEFGVSQAGLFCMESCRLEKGYLHWGHDIGPMDTPLHAGLGFAVDFGKTDFTGRDAMLRQRESGVDRRLLLFEADTGRTLLTHDEPVYRDGELVGRTTSGGLGFRTRSALCFGMVEKPPGSTAAELREATYEIEVAGERFSLAVLDKPPYDPKGLRLRG